MVRILQPSLPANTSAIAVEKPLAFAFIVEEIAFEASVVGELLFAVNSLFGSGLDSASN